MSLHQRFGAAMLVAGVGISCFVGSTTTASATSHWPGAPAGVQLSHIAGTSFTVVARKAANASRYRVLASTTMSDLYGVGLHSARTTRTAAASTVPAVTVRGLRYTAGRYYYRFQTLHETFARMTGIRSVSLRPAVPVDVRIVSGATGLYVTWGSVAATAFTIAQSTDQLMHQHRRNYTIRGQNNQFTPYGLTAGRTYYFRVRAVNGTTASPFSSQLSAAPVGGEQPIRLMTYNILTLATDGRTLTGGKIAPWASERKAAEVVLIKRADPGVIAVQEGSGWNALHQRQVDTLATALGSSYTVAHTEIRWPEPGYARADDYIVYRSDTYQAVGEGGHFSIGGGGTYFAGYQVLRNRASGASFLVVSTHLIKGVGNDAVRQAQTDRVVAGAEKIATAAGGVPVIYGGDFASALARWHPDDAPGVVMREAQAADAYFVSTTRYNDKFSTANNYRRTATLGGILIDRIFATPGVATRSWNQLVNVVHGQFVGVIPSDHNPVVADLSVAYSR